jgi:hypothetical protein
MSLVNQKEFLKILVYQKYTRQFAMPNMTYCVVMQLSVVGFGELLNSLSSLFVTLLGTY